MWMDFWNTTNVGLLECIKWQYFNVLNAYVCTIRAITMQAAILSQKWSFSHKGEKRPHLYENTFTVYIWLNIELPKCPLNFLTPIKQSCPVSKTTWVNSVWHIMGLLSTRDGAADTAHWNDDSWIHSLFPSPTGILRQVLWLYRH